MNMAVIDDIFEFPVPMHVDFISVVNEPEYLGDSEEANRFKPVSAWLHAWYDTIHVRTYYVLALIFGSMLSILWGFVFGVVEFCTVWGVQPFLKLWFTAFRCGYMCNRAWFRMWCDPCFESAALAWSKIGGNLHLKVHVEGKHFEV